MEHLYFGRNHGFSYFVSFTCGSLTGKRSYFRSLYNRIWWDSGCSNSVCLNYSIQFASISSGNVADDDHVIGSGKAFLSITYFYLVFTPFFTLFFWKQLRMNVSLKKKKLSSLFLLFISSC